MLGAFKGHRRGTQRIVPRVPSQGGDWSKAFYLAFWPPFSWLLLSLSMEINSYHPGLPSSVWVLGNQGDKKKIQGGGKKREAKEDRRRTTLLGVLPDSHPCVQIKGSGARKEITHKCCFVVGKFTAGPQVSPNTWGLEWHLNSDFEVKTWNGLKDRLFEKVCYYPEGLFHQRSAEVLELASLVINARKRLMICEGSLISVIHFFPCRILTFQTLSESLRRVE